MQNKTFGAFLAERGIASDETIREAEEAAAAEDKTIEQVLLDREEADEDALYKAKAEYLDLPLYEPEGNIPEEVLREIPEDAARHYQFVPLAIDRDQGRLDVGMLDPEDMAAQEALKFIAFRAEVTPHIFLMRPSHYQEVLGRYTSLRGEVKEALEALEEEKGREEEVAVAERKTAEKTTEAVTEEAPITKMVSVIIRHAIEGGASDIHIEPTKNEIRVRFRVDGVLHTSLILPAQVQEAIVSRIKILSNLKIDVKRVPQDGRFPMEYEGRKVDFRVSTFPTTGGEKVVMRILDPEVGLRTFEDLGLEGYNLETLKETVQRPFGMVLVTGPTGSGKTTTLYAILNALNEEGVNIVSLEDPVEYYIDGVAQSQVRPEIGYTFATGLRHILRQDPDKIMVGEIRDEETASLAVHAALTGHLVLATLHTNDAVGVIPRLVDMGVDKYLLPSTLILAIAQRLVRRLCPESKEEEQASQDLEAVIKRSLEDIPESERERAPGEAPYTVYGPKVSEKCPQGTKGRVAIFEMVRMTPELERVIVEEPSEQNIREVAERQGMITMRQDGIIKALQGLVSIEEVLKVVEAETVDIDLEQEELEEQGKEEPS